MRHGRLVTLLTMTGLTMTGGALWLSAAPASAITISIGGSNPTLPIPVSLPLPIGATVSTGGDGAPLAVSVTAPASTQVAVQAGPTTGLQTEVGVGDAPQVALHVATPAVPVVPDAPKLSLPSALPTTNVVAGNAPAAPLPLIPAPSTSTTPVPSSPGVRVPAPDAIGAPTMSVSPVSSTPVRHASAPPAGRLHSFDASPRPAFAPLSADVSASITPTTRSGFLSAVPAIDRRVMLFALLVALAVAMRLLVGSALATKRVTVAAADAER